jgi:hypothetical protein
MRGWHVHSSAQLPLDVLGDTSCMFCLTFPCYIDDLHRRFTNNITIPSIKLLNVPQLNGVLPV